MLAHAGAADQGMLMKPLCSKVDSLQALKSVVQSCLAATDGVAWE